jgi:hypothetical protein
MPQIKNARQPFVVLATLRNKSETSVNLKTLVNFKLRRFQIKIIKSEQLLCAQ